MLNSTVDRMLCRALVPRSMMRVTSPVFLCRWKRRSSPRVCSNTSRATRLQPPSCQQQLYNFLSLADRVSHCWSTLCTS